MGAVIVPALSERHDVVSLDLPEHDLRDYEVVRQAFVDADVVIHTALVGESAKAGNLHPDNVAIDVNIIEGAIELGVGRLIFISSTHVETFDRSMVRPVRPHLGDARPTTPYGTRKRIVELSLQTLAGRHGLDAVAIRTGAVSKSNAAEVHALRYESWLSHADLARAVMTVVEAPIVAGRFETFYAVSNNPGRRYSTENVFGWSPIDALPPPVRRQGRLGRRVVRRLITLLRRR